MATLKSVESNTAPAFEITCERDDGTVIDLTGNTVTMKLYRRGTQTNTGHEACTVTDATNGVVTWQPQSGDLPSSGTYKGDVKITYGDATVEVLYGQFLLKTRKLLSS